MVGRKVEFAWSNDCLSAKWEFCLLVSNAFPPGFLFGIGVSFFLGTSFLSLVFNGSFLRGNASLTVL